MNTETTIAFSQKDRINWFARLQERGRNVRLLHELVAVTRPSREISDDFSNAAIDVIRKSMGMPADTDLPRLVDAIAAGSPELARTNGAIVRIGYDNFLAYARMHGSLLKLIDHIGLRPYITGLSLGNLRAVHGNPASSETESRPFATSKVHSDVWAAEPQEIMHLWLILYREENGAYMDLFAPSQRLFDENWLRPLDDYDAGSGLTEGEPLPISNAPGEVILFDGSCLHSTVFGGGGLRISFDVKILRHPASDTEGFASQYFPIDEFEAVLRGGN